MLKSRFVARTVVPALVLAIGLVVLVAAPLTEAAAGGPIPRGTPAAESGASVGAGSGTGTQLKVLLVGESVALTLGMGLSEGAPGYGIDFADDATLGCGVAQGEPLTINGQTWHSVTSTCDGSSTDLQWPLVWADEVARFDPDVVLVSVGRWEVVNRYFDGHWTSIDDPAYRDYLAGQLRIAIQVLSARGARVVLLTSPYFGATGFPEDEPSRVTAFNSVLTKVAAQYPAVATVIDLSARVDPGGKYAASLDGVEVRQADGVHFTVPGGQWVGQWLWPQVAAIGRKAVQGPGAEVVTARGQVLSSGSTRWEGDALVFPPAGSTASVNAPAAGTFAAAATTPDHRGYWLAASNGTVEAFGDARFYGPGKNNPAPELRAGAPAAPDRTISPTSTTSTSTPPVSAPPPLAVPVPRTPLFSAPVVSMAVADEGRGYWLAGADGSVYAFGDARTYPYAGPAGTSDPAQGRLASPVVAMAVTGDGRGYWLAGADGSVYPFGDARTFSETAPGAGAGAGAGAGTGSGTTSGSVALVPASPIVAMVTTGDGRGYWLAGADGSVYPFGDARTYPYAGPAGTPDPAQGRLASPVVAVAATGDGRGYWLAGADGSVYPFGDAAPAPAWSAVPLQSNVVALLP